MVRRLLSINKLLDWKRIGRGLLHFIYPPLCLHCKDPLDENYNLFCQTCLDLLDFINPEERCPYCFSIDYSQESKKCGECQQRERFLYRCGAAFDYSGPAATIIRALKYGNQPYLAKGAAAFMLQQFINLNWPLPDCIVPVPLPLTRRFLRGYNQSELLAEEFGMLLGRPVIKGLKRLSGDFSQSGLNREQRMELSSESFILVKGKLPLDQSILLIDDVFTTGSTMQCCAEALQGAYPTSIYGLTFCRTMG